MADGDEHAWLEVKKPKLPEAPRVPSSLEPWLDPKEMTKPVGDEPALREVIHVEAEEHEAEPDEEPVLVTEYLKEHPELQQPYRRFLETWRPWWELYSHRNKVQDLYSELFRIYQQQKRLGEAFELLLGFGLLAWKTPKGQIIRRHVVVAQTEIAFDSQRGVITLRCPPPPEGARLDIEDEFFEPDEQPEPAQYEVMRALLASIGDEVGNSASMHTAIKSWGQSIHPELAYSEHLTPPGTFSTKPSLHFAPAVILRRRTARGTLTAYSQIIEQVAGGGAVPLGLARLVDHLEHADRLGDDDEAPKRDEPPPSPKEVYFPLPANNEQQQIVEKLRHRRGVLVQGPPGTGKSHTIANLISHLLATGKRILITSETPRALRVLKEKIPEQVQPLCVSLLGADSASFSELECSVTGITQRHANWDHSLDVQMIDRLTKDLDKARRAKAKADVRLRDLREAEARPLQAPHGRLIGTMAHITQALMAHESHFSWLTLRHDAPAEPVLSNGEALELLNLGRSLDADSLARSRNLALEPSSLMSPEDFAQCANAEQQAYKRVAAYQSLKGNPAYRALRSSKPERIIGIREGLDAVYAARESLLKRPEPWLSHALNEILAERESAWVLLRKRTRRALEGMRAPAALADSTRIEVPSEHPVDKVLADARAVLVHLNNGGSWSKFCFSSGPTKGKKYLRKVVLVDGKPAKGVESLERLINRLAVDRRLEQTWNLWARYVKKTDAPFETQVAELEEHLECLDLAFELLEKVRLVRALLSSQKPEVPAPNWMADDFEELRDLTHGVESELSHERLVQRINRSGEALTNAAATRDAHPIVGRLATAFNQRDTIAWAEHYWTLLELTQIRAKVSRRKNLIERLAKVAPKVATDLKTTVQAKYWDDRLARLDQAWAWVKNTAWLRDLQDPKAHQKAWNEAHAQEEESRRILSELAAARAWDTFLGRLSQKQSENLQAWRHAVKKIGKGTGKRAEKYRQEARSYLAGCVDAIPAWIMPRYRVAEVMTPKPELFDVVIVDEASQTGIDGLFLYYLGRQVVVVGDDQQISPSDVGVKDAAVNQLQQRYLEGIPFHAALAPTSSLYDHASIRFRGKIVLREHFRCMPEIIQFSNDLCYGPNGTPLVPLRQYAADRLEPVVDRYVEDGYQKGKASSAQNPPEGEALARQVVACAKDERYNGMTFGVVSLVGESQARLIEQMLMESLGPEQIEQRRLVCGNAYAFQGDERDVMFLSLVSAPNARIGALTKEDAKQRFNVAASRAKNQIWLFYSAKTTDLSPRCLRHRLVSYFCDPQRRQDEESEDQFDSKFERDVCERIRGRGFFVRTQVPAGDQFSHKYRIDLVVEGMRECLAVECDGDRWHGPDQYERDMARQRELERAGWKFFRVRESAFRLDPDDALESLWHELDEIGIKPGRTSVEEPPPPADVGFAAKTRPDEPTGPASLVDGDEDEITFVGDAEFSEADRDSDDNNRADSNGKVTAGHETTPAKLPSAPESSPAEVVASEDEVRRFIYAQLPQCRTDPVALSYVESCVTDSRLVRGEQIAGGEPATFRYDPAALKEFLGKVDLIHLEADDRAANTTKTEPRTSKKALTVPLRTATDVQFTTWAALLEWATKHKKYGSSERRVLETSAERLRYGLKLEDKEEQVIFRLLESATRDGFSVAESSKVPGALAVSKMRQPLESSVLESAGVAPRPPEATSTAARKPDGAVQKVKSFRHSMWLGLSRWAKIGGHLDGGDRVHLYQTGDALRWGKDLSEADARRALRLLDQARRLGFDPDAK